MLNSHPFCYIIKTFSFHTSQCIVILFYINLTLFLNFWLCDIKQIIYYNLRKYFFNMFLLCFAMVLSIFFSERTILGLFNGAQGALNLHVISFFILQAVVWWWVCTFFAKLLISGYFVSSDKGHAMCLSMNSTSSQLSFSSILEHLIHELRHRHVQFFHLETPFSHQSLKFDQ